MVISPLHFYVYFGSNSNPSFLCAREVALTISVWSHTFQIINRGPSLLIKSRGCSLLPLWLFCGRKCPPSRALPTLPTTAFSHACRPTIETRKDSNQCTTYEATQKFTPEKIQSVRGVAQNVFDYTL